jgi:hypothetical protein
MAASGRFFGAQAAILFLLDSIGRKLLKKSPW